MHVIYVRTDDMRRLLYDRAAPNSKVVQVIVDATAATQLISYRMLHAHNKLYN